MKSPPRVIGASIVLALSLLVGGAAGNVTDRIVHGVVTDFLEVWLGAYHWPAFNLADSAITIGATLIILDVFFGSTQPTGETSKSKRGQRAVG